MEVKKIIPKSYFIKENCESAYIFLTKDTITINSSYGNFGFYWFCISKDIREFLINCDMYYLMNKLTSYKHLIFDLEYSLKCLCELLFERRYEKDITKKEARQIYDSLKDYNSEYDCDHEIQFYQMIHENDLIYSKLLNYDLEGLSYKSIKPEIEGFWNNLWLPFCEILKEELETEEYQMHMGVLS